MKDGNHGEVSTVSAKSADPKVGRVGTRRYRVGVLVTDRDAVGHGAIGVP